MRCSLLTLLSSGTKERVDDRKCALRIFTKGASDVYTWYRIWAAATAVFSVCVRHRRGGSVRDIGILLSSLISILVERTLTSTARKRPAAFHNNDSASGHHEQPFINRLSLNSPPKSSRNPEIRQRKKLALCYIVSLWRIKVIILQRLYNRIFWTSQLF